MFTVGLLFLMISISKIKHSSFPRHFLRTLKFVLRFISFTFLESKYCHVRTLLYNLHWLPVKFRIDLKILLLTYKAISMAYRLFISRNLLVLKKHVNTSYAPIVMDCY